MKLHIIMSLQLLGLIFPLKQKIMAQCSTNNTINYKGDLITDFHNRYCFDAKCDYDIDTKQQSHNGRANSQVVINVDNGEGKITVYVGDSKYVLDVSDARRTAKGEYKFTCYNYKGGKIPCSLSITDNGKTSFQIMNTENNTGVIHFNAEDW